MAEDVQSLAAAARDAAMRGDFPRAQSLWAAIHRLDPRHPEGLRGLAVVARQRGDLMQAADYLVAAHQAAPQDATIPLMLAEVHRDANSPEGEAESVAIALAIDPYCWPALLMRAEAHRRAGRRGEAVTDFRNALIVAPPAPRWPPLYAERLAAAARDVAEFSEAFEAHLVQALGSSAGQGRWREAAAIMAGRTRPYHADCNQLTVPRLPAIPFFERDQFPWVDELEAKTNAIRAELLAALEGQETAFEPYIAYKPGEPVNQWRELNHSLRWSTYHLYRSGTPVSEHLARCPVTAEALSAVDMADIGGLCPNAMFSALAPHTEIPPHHGETNARLVVHLPLIVPDKCLYRVGFEERRWEVGKALIFDDTLEHTARNDSDELRVVLIFDVWNPLLTMDERDQVRALTSAARSFRFG